MARCLRQCLSTARCRVRRNSNLSDSFCSGVRRSEGASTRTLGRRTFWSEMTCCAYNYADRPIVSRCGCGYVRILFLFTFCSPSLAATLSSIVYNSTYTYRYPCSGNLYVRGGTDVSKHCLYALGVRDAGYADGYAYQCLAEVIERVHQTQVRLLRNWLVVNLIASRKTYLILNVFNLFIDIYLFISLNVNL